MSESIKKRTGFRSSKKRYSLELDLRYKVMRKGEVTQYGVGRTYELSSTEVHFKIDESLPLAAEMELMLEWPLLLNGTCRLQLVIFGCLIKHRRERSILEIARYEFRTRGRSGLPGSWDSGSWVA